MKFNIHSSKKLINHFKVVFIFFLISTSFLFKSSSQDYNFKHININNGLSQNAVFAIMKDSRGFMWFGTKDGLNKFDGYNFVIYQHNPFDSATLSANYITSLFEDSRGLIWVGTFDKGINVYDRTKDVFHRIDLGKDGLSFRNTFEVKAINEDSQGNIWVATSGDGLFRIKINVESFEYTAKRFINEIGNQNSLSSNQVFSIHCDSDDQ